MIHDEFEVRTGDGLILFGQSWIPDSKFDCITCVIHGLGDHSGRFAEFAEFMVKNHIGVFAIDLRGHGKSQGRKGHTPDFDYLLSDVELLIMEIRIRYPEIPVILFGHSLGGTIVSNFVLKHKSKEISGAIISAAWFRLAFKLPKAVQVLSSIISRIIPKISFSDSANPMELTKDPEIGRAFLDDPLKHGSVTAGMFTSASKAAKWCMKKAHLLRYPTLVYRGGPQIIYAVRSKDHQGKVPGKLDT